MIHQLISIAVFLIVIVSIMTEKVHRSVAAVAGAVVLLLTQVLSVETSVSYIDFNTIGVLIGMMLFVAVVRQSGVFEYIAIRSAKLAKGDPWRIMVLFVLITAVLSAFLDNVTTVLLIGPMTIAITRMLEVDPVPFLVTQILASNIGGTATLIGDPPNIMIGSAAGLSFVDFITNTGLAVVIILAVTLLCFRFLYYRSLVVTERAKLAVLELDEKKTIRDAALMKKSIAMIALVALGFVLHSTLHLDSSAIALAGASVMLLIGRQDADQIIADVEWSTIVFFTGLFVVVGGMVESGVINKLAQILMSVTDGHMIITMMVLLWASALLSSVLDNIPFVATLIPLILTMQADGIDVTPFWWAISLGACLGGNGTLIGASANVVLSGIGNKHGYPISFSGYLKVGFPLMILSVIISTIFLLIRYAL
ncbi:ArsB/NhaD family transporter [Bacilliculturomica massiliensis]|uniref:SLC13 family permease n=1 Tax=Bacilliculturomica massiliensis TaxID=1917867 RepID=UPI001030C86D|nr:ArsB/NhaD family transporter [Bacilliculturomica massiliensis]